MPTRRISAFSVRFVDVTGRECRTPFAAPGDLLQAIALDVMVDGEVVSLTYRTENSKLPSLKQS